MDQSTYGKIGIYYTPLQCHQSTRSHYLHQLSESMCLVIMQISGRKEADTSFHVHLRQGAMSKLVTPHVAQGGIKTAYVMVCLPFLSIVLEEEARIALTVAKPSPTTHINRRSPSLQIRPRVHRPLGRIPNDSIPPPGRHPG